MLLGNFPFPILEAEFPATRYVYFNSMAAKHIINLHFIAGQLYVWHADEVEILRREHHIVGSLVGALPGAPRQNTQLGLPLQLMPEEAAVLLQHGIARLVSMSVAKPSKLQVEEFSHRRMTSIKEQKRLWQEHQMEQREQLKDVIEEGRRRKKEKKRQLKQEQSSSNVKTHHHSQTQGDPQMATSGTGDMEAAPLAKERSETIDSGHCGLAEKPVEEEMMVEDESDKTQERLESGKEPCAEDGNRIKMEDSTCSQIPQDVETLRTVCKESSLPGAEPNDSERYNLVKKDKGSKGIVPMIKDNSVVSSKHYKEKSLTNKDNRSAINEEGTEKSLQERTDENDVEGSMRNEKEGKELLGGDKRSVVQECKKENEELVKDNVDFNKERPCTNLEVQRSNSTADIERESVMLSPQVANQHDQSPILANEASVSLPHVLRKSLKPSPHVSSKSSASSRRVVSVATTSPHVAREPVVSSTHVASEAVTTSALVASECFTDEENDEEGKHLMERKTRPSVGGEETVKDDGCSVQIFTAEPSGSKFILEAPTSSWRYPSTDREKLKCRVFQHFWEMGYYLTSGTKFGGDFLVYPGDPVLFHSYFIVVCIPYNKQLSPLELISHGRLGTFVKKAVVLCSVDTHDEVVCTSLQWAGLS